MRVIHWFANNSVAANLLMILIIAGGLLTIPEIKQEVFPEFSSDMIQVSVVYLGAAPEEVEEGVCIRIEEEVQSLDGIKEITSTAAEGVGTVNIELLPGADSRKLLDDVKSRVDAIDTFPLETEKPIVQEVTVRRQVINIAVSGNTDERTLKVVSEKIRDDLLARPEITQVEVTGTRDYEISIEVSESALRQYGLTFDEIAQAVRRSSLDMPGGSIKTDGGEILLRTKGQAYVGDDFENIVLRHQPDGRRITIGDVAAVKDDFAESDLSARFDGKPSAMVKVFRVGEEDAIHVSDAVKEYIARARNTFPEGIDLTIWADDSLILRSRLDLLIRNGRMGLLLVFITLALFLRLRLAFWVAMGIPISFMGAFWLMPYFDTSINMITLFAYIVVIGIVVDDAIVVGENIFKEYESGKSGVQAAFDGVKSMASPVTVAILTTIAAFWPLLNVDGNMGKIMKFIPIIVISTLAFSLVESLLILPAHLSHLKSEKGIPQHGLRGSWRRFQNRFNAWLNQFIDRVYRPGLRLGLKMRYTTVALGIALLIFTVGIVAGGWIKFTFMPQLDSDNVIARLTMPLGTPVEVTLAAIARLEETGFQVIAEAEKENGPIFRHIMASVGEQPSTDRRHGPMGGGGQRADSHLGEVNIELVSSEERDLSSKVIANQWRELTGPIPDAVELTFSSSLFSFGEAINIQLSSSNYTALEAVAAELKQKLGDYPGVFDITDNYRTGKQELKLNIKPEAEALGLTQSNLGRQVRQAFYGEEAQRIQRGRDDIRVMVRYPAEERRSLENLENMRIRLPNGAQVPFTVAAEAGRGRGFSAINRTDRQRTLNVTADVDPALTNATEINRDIVQQVLPEILRDYPDVTFSLEGEQKEQMEALGSLRSGFVMALMIIYILLAVSFKSYWQPLIVMTAIPFGVVGAIWGHWLMGYDIALLSMFGIVALTGVVVNDSLIMVDFINRWRAEGHTTKEAIHEAGAARFRPILLTSLTTFAGLTPLLLERSLQARFMIPMAISLAFGVIFATFITLMLVPVGYHILEDVNPRNAYQFVRNYFRNG